MMCLEFLRIVCFVLEIVFFIFFEMSVYILLLASCLWVVLRFPLSFFWLALPSLLLGVVQYVLLIQGLSLDCITLLSAAQVWLKVLAQAQASLESLFCMCA